MRAAPAKQRLAFGASSVGQHNPLKEHAKEMARRARRLDDRLAPEEELREAGCGQAPHGAAFDPAWRTPAVLALARHIRDDHDGSVLPILADALEEAGCQDEDVLKHCRESAGHRHGCWVVAMLLHGR